MNLTERRFVFLRRLALLCAVMVLAVTCLSAYIRLSKAGLGCADWPQCYGQSLRQLQQGAAVTADEQTATAVARLAHRMVAVIALLLVITMVLVCFGSKPLLRNDGALALALLGLALFLAVLGRWSSGARLPAVAIGNLLGGFAMLALCARLAVAGRTGAWPRLRGWAVLVALLSTVQIALGGLVSASFAGLSCTGWSDCGLAAALQGAGWPAVDPWREPILVAAPPINPAGVLAHSLHRHVAVLVSAVVIPLSIVAWRRGRRRTAAVLLGSLAAQLVAGMLLVSQSLPLGIALMHNLLAAALLAALVMLI
jgi:cytochrome c oxidase assembly protein subunit 15